MKNFTTFLLEESDMIGVDGVMKHRNNSLGNRIHHTDDGIVNFHHWFGASEAIDKQGRPLVVYHGTNEPNIKVFSTNISNGTYHGAGVYFTDNKKDVSNNYTNRENSLVMQNYIKLSNPVHVGGNGTLFEYNRINDIKTVLKKEIPYKDYNKVIINSSNDLEKYVRNEVSERKSGEILNHIYRKLGYDGIIFHSANKLKGHPSPAKTKHYIVFDSANIKSINNKGNFNKGNRAILESTFMYYLVEEIKTKYSRAHETARKNAMLPIEKGGLGLPENNTASDRAKAMGFDVDTKYYHGTNNTPNFTKFKIGKGGVDELGRGVYFTKNVDLARTWANGLYGTIHGGRIIPVFLNKGKIFDNHEYKFDHNFKNDVYKSYSKHISNTDIPSFAKILKEPKETVLKDRFDHESKYNFNGVLEKAGYHSIVDRTSQIDGQINMLHPNRIRSIHAAFDPKKQESEDILA